MIGDNIWWISWAALLLSVPLMVFFWRLGGEEMAMRKGYRVVPHEQTELAMYFIVVDWRGKRVAGPTFYRRMVEECAALNARREREARNY